MEISGADPGGWLATPPPFWFLCFLSEFNFFGWLLDYIYDLYKKGQNGSLNCMDFSHTVYFDSFKSPPKIFLDPPLGLLSMESKLWSEVILTMTQFLSFSFNNVLQIHLTKILTHSFQ